MTRSPSEDPLAPPVRQPSSDETASSRAEATESADAQQPRAELTGNKWRAAFWQTVFGFAAVSKLYWLYAAFAFVTTLWVASRFIGSMQFQLFTAAARLHQPLPAGDWSAPLDDVFIHFDFARSTARGYPFEWLEGNGYSSGGTSLLYPFVLALGYLFGFGESRLMLWALVVAAACVFVTLLAVTRLFTRLPPWTIFLGPVFLLGVGALDWTLFSGMEVAVYLALWAAALIAWDDLHASAIANPKVSLSAVAKQSALLGLALAAMTATRPESAGVVAVFSLMAGVTLFRTAGAKLRAWRPVALSVALSALPSVLVLLSHAVANKLLTGDTAAAGALAKLELYHPLLTRQEVWAKWQEFVVSQVLRLTEYHVSAEPAVGWALWALAAVPLFSPRTRRYALLLWLSAVIWTLTVALNGQVAWQNNRYSMPALAWVLLSASLGVGLAVRAVGVARDVETPRRRRGASVFLAASVVTGWLLLSYFQVPRFREQIWFFGRASRNIYDQQTTVGLTLRDAGAHRVLLGDAGAIPYASDLPALDIIGLGGYHGMPFARAQRWGAAAALELIGDIAPDFRPDMMALYPTWWGTLPLWFGTPLFGVSVRGNVICGGRTKMVYRPDWAALDGSNNPSAPPKYYRVVDALDAADLTTEIPAGFQVVGAPGYVDMKMLANPNSHQLDLWDAGRILPQGASAEFRLRGFQELKETTLVLRSAVHNHTELEITVNGVPMESVQLGAEDAWQQSTLVVPREHVRDSLQIAIRPRVGGYTFYHLWAMQKK